MNKFIAHYNPYHDKNGRFASSKYNDGIKRKIKLAEEQMLEEDKRCMKSIAILTDVTFRV